MNFLAHLYLSPKNPEIRLGNFIADSVKGSQVKIFSEEVQKGILLHRQIDAYTDNHPVVKKCVEHLRPHFRLYSPVVLDIYFDHFLARNWAKYSTKSLADFSEKQYRFIESYEDILPERLKVLFKYMKEGNWLLNYKDVDFLKKVFAGMTQRTPYVSNMQEATTVLVQEYDFYKNHFFSFFADICSQFLDKENIST